MAAVEDVETASPSVTASSPVTPSLLSQSQSIDSITSASASASSGSGSGSGCGTEDSVTPTRRRYPVHLSHGSPPGTQRQQKRPNSSHYETMEDLLAAAGYAHTRVFTPETERVQRLASGGADERGKHVKGEGDGKGEAGGLGTLVAGWFAHILPAAHGSGSSRPPEVRVEVEEDADSNPFLRPGGAMERHFPQATRSVSCLFDHLGFSIVLYCPRSWPSTLLSSLPCYLLFFVG